MCQANTHYVWLVRCERPLIRLFAASTPACASRTSACTCVHAPGFAAQAARWLAAHKRDQPGAQGTRAGRRRTHLARRERVRMRLWSARGERVHVSELRIPARACTRQVLLLKQAVGKQASTVTIHERNAREVYAGRRRRRPAGACACALGAREASVRASLSSESLDVRLHAPGFAAQAARRQAGQHRDDPRDRRTRAVRRQAQEAHRGRVRMRHQGATGERARVSELRIPGRPCTCVPGHGDTAQAARWQAGHHRDDTRAQSTRDVRRQTQKARRKRVRMRPGNARGERTRVSELRIPARACPGPGLCCSSSPLASRPSP